jgi:hypothetical protein
MVNELNYNHIKNTFVFVWMVHSIQTTKIINNYIN